jgi:hypothetical protein
LCVAYTWPWCQGRCLRPYLRGVVDAGFSSWLSPAARNVKTNVCGRSFAVLSTQAPTAGLCLRHNRLTCGNVLEVSSDASAAGEENLASCAAEQRKYCSICTVNRDFCGDLPFTSWGRWQCLRGGADVGFNSCYAVCGCGTEYRCGPCRVEALATCLRRWRALPLIDMVPFHSTQKAAGSKFPSKVLWTRFEIVLEG